MEVAETPLPVVVENSGEVGAREPCAWESGWLQNPWRAYWQTIRSLFTDPVHFFARIRSFDSMASLLTFMYLNFFIFLFSGTILMGLASLVGLSFGVFQNAIPTNIMASIFGMGLLRAFVLGSFGLFFLPAVQVLVTVLVALLIHLFMTFVGGSQKDYTATLTVYGLSTGLNWLVLLMIVPFVGPPLHGLVRLAYFVLVNIFGLAKAHEITPGKVFVSYLIPFGICCCLMAAVGMMVPALLGFLAR